MPLIGDPLPMLQNNIRARDFVKHRRRRRLHGERDSLDIDSRKLYTTCEKLRFNHFALLFLRMKMGLARDEITEWRIVPDKAVREFSMLQQTLRAGHSALMCSTGLLALRIRAG